MRAVAAFPAEKKLRLIHRKPPSLEADTEVLVRIVDVGVCGTDREIARFDYGTPPRHANHLEIGHESLSQVVETGPGVTRVKPGDLVVLTVRRPCGHAWCRACQEGRQDFCFSGDFTERGIKGRHGYMTELVVDDERFAHVVPPGLRDVGVLVEPLTIAEKALTQVWDVQDRMPWTVPGHPPGAKHARRAVVVGAGPVGLLGAMALRVRGFETWVYSREPANGPRAQWVQSVDARYVSSEDATPAQLAEQVGNIDLVYEATGASGISFRMIEVLGVNGVFIFTGVPGRKAPIEVDADLIMRNLVLKNQLVFGTVNAGPASFDAAIEDLAKFDQCWPKPLRSLIAPRHAPEEFEALLLGPPSGIKHVIAFGEPR
ncbi:MAG: glucose 1-dehydrogenase [Myxococcales bacterium]|nr:glucose 1-dehydrogenase [Myxococcales bacterium]